MSLFETGLLTTLTTMVIAGCLAMIYVFYKLAMILRSSWKKNQECQWKPITDYCSEYDSGCGHSFANMQDGNPVTDWANYCPFCGNTIVEQKE